MVSRTTDDYKRMARKAGKVWKEHGEQSRIGVLLCLSRKAFKMGIFSMFIGVLRFFLL